jgi:hypothetical protein
MHLLPSVLEAHQILLLHNKTPCARVWSNHASPNATTNKLNSHHHAPNLESLGKALGAADSIVCDHSAWAQQCVGAIRYMVALRASKRFQKRN